MTDKDLGAADCILNNVQMDPNGGCWLWFGKMSGWGYGQAPKGLGHYSAHRLSYATFNGPIGDKWVLHKCDVRACVNPEHLYLGTHKDNMADMLARGREARGERMGSARLTDAEVIEIRASPESSRQLEKRLPVTSSMIRRIRRGQAWTHVQAEVNQNNQVIP